MAFDFGSDILVDAMKAADPQQAAEARLKLQKLSAASKVDTADAPKFSAEVSAGNRRTAIQESPQEVLQKFESVVLSTFVQAMMPKEASSVYGEGLSGDMWKAQMAEKIGEQLARNGGIGIADRLLKSYQVEDETIKPIAGLHDPSLAVSQTRAADGASQFLQKLELSALLGSDKEAEPASSILNSNPSAA